MKEQTLIVFASLVSLPIIIIAILVLAVVLVGGAIFLRRGDKNKSADAAMGGNDWQPQAQQEAWNQQGSAAGWNQQQNSWGGQGAQQQANPWGAPQQQQQQQQQQANPWGNPNPAQNAGPASNPWGAPQQPQQQQWGGSQAGQSSNPWGAPQQQQQPMNQTQPGGQWGNQGAQNPWEAAPAAAPAAQNSWGAPQQGSGQQWGQQPQQPQQQQGPNSFSGVSGQQWGQQQQQPADPWAQQQQQPADPWAQQQQQQQPADPWAAQQQQQGSYNGVQNAWQQPSQPGNFNQGGGFGAPAADPNAQYGMDNDRTVLRSASSPQQYAGNAAGANTVGYVRVEEGKEPGRIYEVRKESLSIGRSRESDIFLEDLAVSRLHASIVNLGNGNYALKDEGSANGTKVNGQLVNKFQTYPLQDGDRVQLGQTVLVFGRK